MSIDADRPSSTPPPAVEAEEEATQAWVLEFLRSCTRPGALEMVDLDSLSVHAHGGFVACCVHRRESFDAPARRQVAVVDLHTGSVGLVEVPFAQSAGPTWSSDGRLAVVGHRDDGTSAAVVLSGLSLGSADPAAGADLTTTDLPGSVEVVAWSPDGTRLAMQVADPGAEISDTFGSGTVGGGEADWAPRVQPRDVGRRHLVVWTPGTASSPDSVRRIGTRNVWELTWCGDEAVLVLESEDPGEGAWYAARLTRYEVGSGSQTRSGPGSVLLRGGDVQLAQPRCAPHGSGWSVVSGVQSDRGLPAGDLLVSTHGTPPQPLATAALSVTDHQWLDERTIRFAGLRDLETVVGTVDVHTGEVVETWSGLATAGSLRPEIGSGPGETAVLVHEDHDHPPTLAVLEEAGVRPVVGVEGEGAGFAARHAGSTTTRTWTSSDGLEISGLLTVPDGEAPYPLVLHVHGGPTHAWRSTWCGRDPHTSVLVARGYAVLRANPRGSSGRGAAFAAAVQGDMGGLDLDDVVSGVESLIAAGLVDPTRVGITGISYGGFAASWAPCRSDLFAASVARSPCTDWLTQTLTSNIAEFDRLFVVGDPFDPDSAYARRSPLRAHENISTPMLLTAGLLDLATPLSQAQVLHHALRLRGVPTELVVYPEEGHGVQAPLAVADQVARMLTWFERYLPPTPRA